MIKVDRGDAPEGFANRADAWRARFAEERRQKADMSQIPDTMAAGVRSGLCGSMGDADNSMRS